MREILPLALLSLSLLYAAAIIGGVSFRSLYERSPGLASLLFPFSVLFVSGSITWVRMLLRALGLDCAPMIVLNESVRMLTGLGWLFLCHAHLAMHGILGFRRRLAAPLIAITAACIAFYVLSSVFAKGTAVNGIALGAGRAVMSITALYAALTAVFTLRKGIRLWPSSLAGLRMAIFALIAYPVSLLIERTGLRVFFLDPARSVFEQLYPLFMAAFATLAVPAIAARGKGPLIEPGDRRAALTLTDREREVALLLRDGKTLKEIANRLSVSVPTVKSHSNRVYKKLEISSRKDLSLVRFE